jgi:serine/threonine protein kinase
MRGDRSNRRAQLSLAYDELGRDLTSKRLRIVGNYTLQRTIGEGTFGRVRRATHRLTNTHVAVKQVPKAHIASLTREIHHHRRIHHPNIVQLFEVIETESNIWLVFELCSGGELYDYIVERGTIPEPEARIIFGQLCLAIAHIHSLGIVHRDLKLENILLDAQRNVKLSDFGFTREFESRMYMDTRCGTTAYAAPEMLANKRYLGQEIDIWSLGIILFVLLCGYLPFDDDDDRELRHQIIKAPVLVPLHLSAEAQNLIYSILQKDGSRRLSIFGILSHPWFAAPVASPAPLAKPDAPTPQRQPLREPVDFCSLACTSAVEPFSTSVGQQLLQQLFDMGISVGQMRHSIMSSACDASGALWWLLYRKAQHKKAVADEEAVKKVANEPPTVESSRSNRTSNLLTRFKSWMSSDLSRDTSSLSPQLGANADLSIDSANDSFSRRSSLSFLGKHRRRSVATQPPAMGSITTNIPPTIVAHSPQSSHSRTNNDTSDDQHPDDLGTDAQTHRMLALQALERSPRTPISRPHSRRTSVGSTSSARPLSTHTSRSWQSSGDVFPRSSRKSRSYRRSVYRNSGNIISSRSSVFEKHNEGMGKLLLRHMSLDEAAIRGSRRPISIVHTPNRPRSVALYGSPTFFSNYQSFMPRSSQSHLRKSRQLPRNPSVMSSNSGFDDTETDSEKNLDLPRRFLTRRNRDDRDDDWVDVDDDCVFGGIGQLDLTPGDEITSGLGLHVRSQTHEGMRRSDSPVTPAPALHGSLAMLGQPVDRQLVGSTLSRALKARHNMNTSIIEEE